MLVRIGVISVLALFLGLVLRVFVWPSARDYRSTLAADLGETADAEQVRPASNRIEAEAPTNTLRVALNHNPPRKIVRGVEFSGTDVDILEEFARRMEVSLAFSSCELNACLDKVKNGSADAVVGVARTPEREKFLEYLDPAISLSVAKSFYQKPKAPMIDEYADLYGKRIGILHGYEYFPKFDRDKKLKKKTYSTMAKLVAGLQKSEIDVFVGYEDRTDYTLSQVLNVTNVKKAKLEVRENILVHFLTVGKNSGFIQQTRKIEDVLSDMYLEGAVQKIVDSNAGRFRVRAMH